MLFSLYRTYNFNILLNCPRYYSVETFRSDVSFNIYVKARRNKPIGYTLRKRTDNIRSLYIQALVVASRSMPGARGAYFSLFSFFRFFYIKSS